MQKVTRSQALYEEALKVLPGGVSRNTVYRRPHPFYADHASGCRVVDLEGVERIDFANNMASLIHGHAHPQIVDAVSKQLHRGCGFIMSTEVEVRFAQHMCKRAPGFDKIRFMNSGTEAVMTMLKAARAYTGKPKIAKVEGAYHGSYDYAEVSQTANPQNWGDAAKPTSVAVANGTPTAALNDVVVIPFNDPETAQKILNQYAGEIACVLVDPLPHRVGLMPAADNFIETLYQWTRDNGALLAFDEVITFRNGYAGTQANYSCSPDLTAMGKFIGGGFPVGALAGKEEVMKVLDPSQETLLLPHSGTFSANPITMTAGLVAMELFDEAAVIRLNQLATLAKERINEAITSTGIKACVTGAGSMLRVHLKEVPPTNYRSAYCNTEESHALKLLLDYLYDHGLMMINTCSAALSTALSENEIDQLAETLQGGFNKIKNLY